MPDVTQQGSKSMDYTMCQGGVHPVKLMYPWDSGCGWSAGVWTRGDRGRVHSIWPQRNPKMFENIEVFKEESWRLPMKPAYLFPCLWLGGEYGLGHNGLAEKAPTGVTLQAFCSPFCRPACSEVHSREDLLPAELGPLVGPGRLSKSQLSRSVFFWVSIFPSPTNVKPSETL